MAMRMLPMCVAGPVLALALVAQAASEFTTIRRTQVNLSDGSPRLLATFVLPANVNLSTSTANSAVLQMEVLGSTFDFNEVYVNPPTTTCVANDTDANQSRSIGFLQEHDDTSLRNEWATNHIAFSSGFLRAGSNTLMVCIRSETGGAGPSVGNLDNISLRSIVLHFHTQ